VPANTDYTKRSDAQLRANLTSKLDAIWRMGDRDECSIKHVAYGLACIELGLPFDDGLDYHRPWAGDNEDLPATFLRNRELKLVDHWVKVQRVRDSIGPKRFHTVLQDSKFMSYKIYLEDLSRARGLIYTETEKEEFSLYISKGVDEKDAVVFLQGASAPDVYFYANKDRSDDPQRSLEAMRKVKEVLKPHGLSLRKAAGDRVNDATWADELLASFEDDAASTTFRLMSLT
jgi:hypothetical protein